MFIFGGKITDIQIFLANLNKITFDRIRISKMGQNFLARVNSSSHFPIKTFQLGTGARVLPISTIEFKL